MHKLSMAARTRPSFVRSLRAPLAMIALAALAACAIPTHPDSSAPPPDPFNPAVIQLIDDTNWQLASWRNADGTQRELPQEQAANGQPRAPTLTLSNADGVRRASGFSGCNRFGSTYVVKNGLLSFGPLVGTRMTCPNSAGSRLEAPYLDALAHVTKAGLQMQAPQQLYLVTQDGATLIFSHLAPRDPVEMRGRTTRLGYSQDNRQYARFFRLAARAHGPDAPDAQTRRAARGARPRDPTFRGMHTVVSGWFGISAI